MALEELGKSSMDGNEPVQNSGENTKPSARLTDGPRTSASQQSTTLSETGIGLSMFGLIVGLATGIGVYALIEYWFDQDAAAPTSFVAVIFLISASAGTLLLASKNNMALSIAYALANAALLAIPSYFIFSKVDLPNLDEFPMFFWLGIGLPLSAYILTVIARATLQEGAPPPYSAIFYHGITLPLIAAGGKVFAGLALLLLVAWSFLLNELGVSLFRDLLNEAWFILPFLGAIGGLSIMMIRAQQSVLGALRFILLLFSRIAMPIMAVFSLTLLIVFAVNGVTPVFDRPYPSAWILGLSFAGMLIFNGVYQNGEAAPPPLWLRLSTIIANLSFPIYAGIAAYAFWLRVSDYGLTPPRIAGLLVTALAFAYSVIAVVGVISEINWRSKRWMPLVGPLNSMMAGLWVIALIVISTPLLNPWAISAKSQEQLLLDQKIAAKDFDFRYLRFRLGEHGLAALDRLALLTDHPELDEIKAGVADAQTAEYYSARPLTEPTAGPTDLPSEDGAPTAPMQLELNPTDNPDKDEAEEPSNTGPDAPSLK